MAGQTKMIIITSDEDIIRQFSFNKNTHMIDLDNNTQITSTTNDNNLNFIAQLSQLNSNNDQVYKRALDSTDHNRTKSVRTLKKSIDMVCVICGDRAIGYNYDILSCASCKVYFRRNANLDLEKIQCLTGQGQCSVGYEVHRKCRRCRLDRCFAMGMRKDFILSHEEKLRRKKCLEENRNNSSQSLLTSSSNVLSNSNTSEQIDQPSMNINDDDYDTIVVDESTNSNEIIDTLFETLSVEDWLTIQSVRSLFLTIFGVHDEQCACFDISGHVSAIISCSQFLNRIALSFINFFRQIEAFGQLDLDDRFILIKYNIFSVLIIHKTFYYKSTHDCCSNDGNEAAERHRRFFMLCGDSYGIRDGFVNTVHSLVELSEQDPTFLSLFSLILIFSQGLSVNENEPLLKDPLAVNRAQVYYTQVLWSYLVNKYGEIEACKQFTKLVTLIFRIQSIGKTIREFFRAQFTTTDTLDQIAPIMQSVLHIS